MSSGEDECPFTLSSRSVPTKQCLEEQADNMDFQKDITGGY